MERALLPGGTSLRWRGPALAFFGALLLAGALALGGGGALLVWSVEGLARWPLHFAAMAGLYLAPGLTLLRLLWPRDRALAPITTLALALGMSMCLPPLLLLLFQQLGLAWGGAATWVYLLLSVLAYFGFWILDFGAGRQSKIQNPKPKIAFFEGADLALIGVTLAALAVRLYAVRDLHVGLLGDSYHHTLMAQLLVENRGIFHSWEPYAPLATFTYHFGFHANVAFAHWITGMDLARSVVWTGQVINAIMAPLAFALVVALGGPRWAGVWAAAIVGFVSLMPAFFVNWGRYTQLTGQVVLVVVLVCWIALAEPTNDQRRTTNDERRTARNSRWSLVVGRWSLLTWRPILLAGLATAALILTHYLVTALAAALVGSYLLALTLAKRSWRFAGALMLRAGAAAALALLLALPWLLNVRSGYLMRNASALVSGAVTGVHVAQLSSLATDVRLYPSRSVLLGALIGLCVAGWRRDWRMALPAVWSILLAIAVVPYVVGLPGAGVIDNITGLGTLYLPTTVLAGFGAAAAQEQAARLLLKLSQGAQRKQGAALTSQPPLPHLGEGHKVLPFRHTGGMGMGENVLPYLSSALGGALLLLVIARGTAWQQGIIAGDTALVSGADLAAMEWVRANTPPDARFLVNSFPAYGGTLVAGTDAGWWLPLLAQRATTLPPLTYGSELGAQPDYSQRVNGLAMALRRRPLTDLAPVSVNLNQPKVLKALCVVGVNYVYSGAHPFPGPGGADRIDTTQLQPGTPFRRVYAQDGVEIFQFERNVC